MEEVWDRRGNRMVRNQYDSAGRVIHQTLSDGGTYQLGYTTATDGTVTQTTVTDPGGSTQRVRFDASGYPSEDTQALATGIERTTLHERNAIGLLQASVDPLGRRTEFAYDTQMRLTGTTVLAGTAQALTSTVAYNAQHDPISSTDAEGRVTTMVWDARRRLEKIIDHRQREVRYSYDSHDHVVSVTDPQNRVTTFSYQLHDLVRVTDAQGRTTKRSVDALGRTRTLTDAQGRSARLDYDTLDRVITQHAPDGSTTHFGYDPMGNLKSLTDASLSITRWDYDTRQRPILHRDALNQVETWSYMDDLRRVTHTDRQLRGTTYAYDELGRLDQVQLSDGDTINHSYDAGDRLLSIWDHQSGAISYDYNRLDLVTRETTDQGTIDYGYDGLGRLTTSTLSANPLLPIGYPKTFYRYDELGRPSSISRGHEHVQYGYDTQDRRTSVTLPNGTVQGYSYDNEDRLSRIEYRRGGALIGDLNYGFDAAGQLTSRTGSFAEDLLPPTSGPATHNANHQQTASGAHQYSFDGSGNLLTDTDTDANRTLTYGYDARDRMVSITDSRSGAIADFQYDVLGRRTSKTVDGVHTEYRYDGDNVIEEDDGATVITTLNGFGLDERYSRGIDVDDSVGTINAGAEERSNFLADALGSTIGLQDARGHWQARYYYTPYGETQTQLYGTGGAGAAPTALNNPFQYTGRENDGNGLYYYRARYYNPTQGRFTQEDPLGFVDGPNPYAYVGGNPLQFRDPYGLYSWDDFIGDSANYSAGFGDTLSFGLTNYIRSQWGIAGVNKCSTAYAAGRYTELGVEVALTGGSFLLRGAAKGITQQAARAGQNWHGVRGVSAVHHINPLKEGLFPFAWLPGWIRNGRWNLELLSLPQHKEAHAALARAGAYLTTLFNPATTGARIIISAESQCECN